MIGLSVSRCIRAILEGEVRLEDVEKIIAGIRASDEEAWDFVIREYRERHWDLDPDGGEEICCQLIAKGKIEQPRLQDNWRLPVAADGSIWVSSEEEIQWAD